MCNEALCVREFCSRVDSVLEQIASSYEIIVVDDGSTDGTVDILHELSKSYPNLRPLPLTRNCGQSAALYAGIQHSVGKYVVVMDGDLQNVPEEIPLLINEIRKGYELVSGWRRQRSESFWFRRLPSLIANFVLRATTGCQIRDMGGFKCLYGDIARQLHLRAGQHRLLPALIHTMGGRLSEVVVSFPPRSAGRSHYGIGRSLDVLLDILLLWFQLSFKSRPLYLFGRISLWLLLFGSAVLSWLLYDKFVYDVDMGSRPPFIATIVIFLSSLGFMSLGFILEILSDLYNAISDRKPYHIQTTHAQTVPKDNSIRRAA